MDIKQPKRVEYAEMYVGNATQASHYYSSLYGFSVVAYGGPETGLRDRSSYILTQGSMKLILTSPTSSEGAVAEHIQLHGDSVKDVAFHVQGIDALVDHIYASGISCTPIETFETTSGVVRTAKVSAVGDLVHSLIDYGDADVDSFLPSGYVSRKDYNRTHAKLFSSLDHVAIAVPKGELDDWVSFYKEGLYLHEAYEQMISPDDISMNSKVLAGESYDIKFPLVESSSIEGKSQVDEFIKFNGGPGVQHLAWATDDIVNTVSKLRLGGVGFVQTPDTYYDLVEERVGVIDRNHLKDIRDLKVLIDTDEWGRLQQIFTKPVTGRATMFVEVIQRNGAKGFGAGNIRALYEAVEREQMLRGNLK